MSTFLPENFSSNSKIIVLAGRGNYPIECVKHIINAGHDVHVLLLDDDANASDYDMVENKNISKMSIGQIGKVFKEIKRSCAEYAIMAGQIKPKKLFHGLKPDLKAIMILAALKEKNAETIFGTISKEIEKLGVKILDARSFMDDDISTKGPMIGKFKQPKQYYIDHGIHIAKEVARLDIGQSVVVRHGTVLAVEDFSGTNNMIRRIADFNVNDAIFVKTSKPNQDFRFDVPVFGTITLDLLNEVGIRHVLLEAGSVIVLNKRELLNKAKQYNISIYGF